MRGLLIRFLAPLLLAVGLGACASNAVQPGIVYSSGVPAGGTYTQGPYGSGGTSNGPYGGATRVSQQGGGQVQQASAPANYPAQGSNYGGLVGALLGAVGGAIAGSIAEGQHGSGRGIEVTVQRDDGQQVTVAQRDEGDIQLGDRVQIVQNRQGVAQVVRDNTRRADTQQ